MSRLTSSLRRRRGAGADVGAGSVLGLVSVPDGLATGLLAGMNPVTGLYAYLVGTLVGGLATSSALMSVQATGAMAVVLSDVPLVRDPDDGAGALVTLTVMTGLVMVLLGVLRLGSLLRFVPNAVLTGFVNAVAVTIVLAQLPGVTGYDSPSDGRLARAADTLLHPLRFEPSTLLVAGVTLGLILALERTRLGPFGMVVAVLAGSGLAAVLPGVELVGDVADIPDGLPGPVLPDLSSATVLALLLPALSLAFVGLVQGAAITQSVPGPDGRYGDVSGDFRGQGVANVAAGVLQGMPVGGSMSATSLLVAAGARSRLANLVAALVIALVVLVAGDAAELIAMPSLAALLLLVGVRTVKVERLRTVLGTGAAQATVMATTFVLTLVIPLQFAVLVGVGISVILYVTAQSNRVLVRRWVFDQNSPLPRETAPPGRLPGGETVLLTVYGSVFFASASVIEAQLPAVDEDSASSAVVLRLRGEQDLGSTAIAVLTRYAGALHQVGSHLLLAGVSEQVYRQLLTTGALSVIGEENVFRAGPSIGRATSDALARARLLTQPDAQPRGGTTTSGDTP